MRARSGAAGAGKAAAALAVLAALGGCGGAECEPAPGRICTIAGTGIGGLSEDGLPPLESELFLPQDVSEGEGGEIYIVDYNNHAVRVLRGGAVDTVLGVPGRLGDAPEGPAIESAIHHPSHVAPSEGGAIVSAWHNYLVLRLDSASGEVTRVAGTGEAGAGGAGAPATETALNRPSATVPREDGRLVISDQLNHRIVEIDEGGVVRSVAGTGEAGFSGDGGPAEEARLRLVAGGALVPGGKLDVSEQGEIYVADTENHVIRAIDEAGEIDTIAGTGEAGFDAGGSPRESALYAPADVEVAGSGALYVADTRNSCVRRIAADRASVETIAGVCGETGYDGDGGPANEALLDRPYGVALGSDDTLYIADTHNHVVRAVY